MPGGLAWSTFDFLSIRQICMAMSTAYHTFCCRSQNSYHFWLSYDLCGISFSLLAIYATGIYYAFWCQNVSNFLSRQTVPPTSQSRDSRSCPPVFIQLGQGIGCRPWTTFTARPRTSPLSLSCSILILSISFGFWLFACVWNFMAQKNSCQLDAQYSILGIFLKVSRQTRWTFCRHKWQMRPWTGFCCVNCWLYECYESGNRCLDMKFSYKSWNA